MAVIFFILFFSSCWSWANLIINSLGLVVKAMMTKAYFFATSQLRSLADLMDLLKWTRGCLPWFLLSKIDCLWLLDESICTAPVEIEPAWAGSVGCAWAYQGSSPGHAAGAWGEKPRLSIFWSHLPWCWVSVLLAAAGCGCVLVSRRSSCSVRYFSEGE